MTAAAAVISSMAAACSIANNLSTRVPDWVVLGRILDLIRSGLPVPADVYEPDALGDYVPALLAAGHTHSQIYRATGTKAERHDPSRRAR